MNFLNLSPIDYWYDPLWVKIIVGFGTTLAIFGLMFFIYKIISKWRLVRK